MHAYVTAGSGAVDGGWSKWRLLKNAILQNGKVYANQQRMCDEPPPANGGKDCKGREYRVCSCKCNKCKG